MLHLLLVCLPNKQLNVSGMVHACTTAILLLLLLLLKPTKQKILRFKILLMGFREIPSLRDLLLKIMQNRDTKTSSKIVFDHILTKKKFDTTTFCQNFSKITKKKNSNNVSLLRTFLLRFCFQMRNTKCR